MGLPEPLDGDGDVIEAAIAAKKVPAGVVASGPDEGKGIDQLPEPNMFRRRNHPSDRVASGRSEGVFRHFRDQVRRVDLENQLVGHRLRLEQNHLRKGEYVFQGAWIICQASAHRQIAPLGETPVVEDPGP
jgi:hypothetical protein